MKSCRSILCLSYHRPLLSKLSPKFISILENGYRLKTGGPYIILCKCRSVRSYKSFEKGAEFFKVDFYRVEITIDYVVVV